MVKNIQKYLRTTDWLDSKVPFMISIALFLYVFSDTDIQWCELYVKIGAYFLYTSMFLAFSYVINDFTDIDVDIKAGKHKVMHRMSKLSIIVSMVAMILVGTGPMFYVVENKLIFAFYTFFLYLTGAAYSVHWLFRFKERGLIGLIECSIAQKCLPLVPLMNLFQTKWYYLVMFILVSFVNGLRYILIHQAVDYENDIKSGVKTFVSEGHNKYRIAILLSFTIESALMFLVFIRLGFEYHFIFLILITYCIFEKIISIVVIRYMKVDWFCTFLAVPLESLYNVFFPILMATVIVLRNDKMFGVLVFLVLLTANCFKGKAAFLKVYINSKVGHR